MAWQALAIAGLSAIQSRQQSRANSRAVGAQTQAGRDAIDQQEAARLDYLERTDPFATAGLAAAPALMELLGIDIQGFGGGLPEATQQADIDRRADAQLAPIREEIASLERLVDKGNPKFKRRYQEELNELRLQENEILAQQARDTATNTQVSNAQASVPTQAAATPVTSSQPAMLEEVNPLVSFVRDEGFRDIQESAAAGGNLRSGGTLRDLTEFNTNVAATVVPQLQQQRFNQLFNLLGLGSNAATGQATAGLNTAANIGGLLGNIGTAQAHGALNQGNINSNLVGDLAGTFGYFRGNQQAGGGQQINTVNNPNQFAGYA